MYQLNRQYPFFRAIAHVLTEGRGPANTKAGSFVTTVVRELARELLLSIALELAKAAYHYSTLVSIAILLVAILIHRRIR